MIDDEVSKLLDYKVCHGYSCTLDRFGDFRCIIRQHSVYKCFIDHNFSGWGYACITKKIGNVAATIADFGLALVLIWLVGSFLYEQPVRVGMAAFVSAIVITVGEFLYHKYLQNQFFTDEKPTLENDFISNRKDNLQTEFGSEYDIEKQTEEEPTDRNQMDNITIQLERTEKGKY